MFKSGYMLYGVVALSFHKILQTEKKRIFRIVLIITSILITQIANSQEYRLNVGLGLPDLIHFGGYFQYSQNNEIGVQFGSIISEHNIIASTFEHRVNIDKSTKYENLNTWFLGQRLTYHYEKGQDYSWHFVFPNLSFGRNHYLSDKFGFSWDAGLLFVLMNKKINNKTGLQFENDEAENHPTFFPSLRIQFFRRFG